MQAIITSTSLPTSWAATAGPHRRDEPVRTGKGSLDVHDGRARRLQRGERLSAPPTRSSPPIRWMTSSTTCSSSTPANRSTGDGFIYDFTRSDFKVPSRRLRAARTTSSPTSAPSKASPSTTSGRIRTRTPRTRTATPSKRRPRSTPTRPLTPSPTCAASPSTMRSGTITSTSSPSTSMVEMFSNGGWNEKADEENGVPESYDADSPYGFYAGQLKISGVNKWYCGAPMGRRDLQHRARVSPGPVLRGRSLPAEAERRRPDHRPVAGLRHEPAPFRVRRP